MPSCMLENCCNDARDMLRSAVATTTSRVCTDTFVPVLHTLLQALSAATLPLLAAEPLSSPRKEATTTTTTTTATTTAATVAAARAKAARYRQLQRASLAGAQLRTESEQCIRTYRHGNQNRYLK